MLQSCFSSQSEYSAPSSVCPSWHCVCCPYTCTIGWLYLLQSVAQFSWGKAGAYSDWRWNPAGDVFCSEKVCLLLWGSALLLAWVGWRGIAVHLQNLAWDHAWTSALPAYSMFCDIRGWPHFSAVLAVLWISCGPPSVSSAI